MESSQLEFYSSAHQNTQRQSSAAERSGKCVHCHGKSERTIRRHKKAKRDLEAQGFFSLPEFFKRKGLSTKHEVQTEDQGDEEAAGPQIHEAETQVVAGSARSAVGSTVLMHVFEEEEEEEEEGTSHSLTCSTTTTTRQRQRPPTHLRRRRRRRRALMTTTMPRPKARPARSRQRKMRAVLRVAQRQHLSHLEATQKYLAGAGGLLERSLTKARRTSPPLAAAIPPCVSRFGLFSRAY